MLAYLLDAFAGPAAAFMYALLMVMAIAIAVVIERMMFFIKTQQHGEVVLRQFKKGTPGNSTPMERVAQAALPYKDPDLAFEAMTAASIEAEQQIRTRVAYLGTIASIATMLGLFGTVYGLILAFGALGDVAAAERAAQLSEGSSTAMATTAFGLLVAIPAMAAHAALEAVVRDRLAKLEVLATRIILFRKSGS